MNRFSFRLLATAALGLGLAGCDSSSSGSKKEATQTRKTAASTAADTRPAASGDGRSPATAPAGTKASEVALPAGLKVGRWQAFLLARQHAVHFVFEVAVENNSAVGYLVNEGPNGPERLRCDNVRATGDSAIISLPGTAATLVVRANGVDHLAGAWVEPGSKTPARTALSAVYGERSTLRPEVATPIVAGSWCATFKPSNGKAYRAAVVFEQEGATLVGSLAGPGGSYRYLSGAALSGGIGMSSFDGRRAVLLQAQKQPNGTLKGDFYFGRSGHETWTAVPAKQANCPN